MSSFIELDERGHYIQSDKGYYKTLLSFKQLYTQVSDKFKLSITFFGEIYLCLAHLLITSPNFKMSIYFYKSHSTLTILTKYNIWLIIFHQNTHNPIEFRSVQDVLNKYENIQLDLPSIKDVMSFLDLIPIDEKLLSIKDLFLNENKLKSCLELLMDYDDVNIKPFKLVLPMVII